MQKKLSFTFVIIFVLLFISDCTIIYTPKSNKPGDQKQGLKTIFLNRQIKFSGYDWIVRNDNITASGPGPNLFSNSTSNVWIDSNGFLHIKIRQFNRKWYCSEVDLTKSLGYGSYIFNVGKGFQTIDPMAVLGLFTYLNGTNQIDIELSQ